MWGPLTPMLPTFLGDGGQMKELLIGEVGRCSGGERSSPPGTEGF